MEAVEEKLIEALNGVPKDKITVKSITLFHWINDAIC